MCNQQDSPAFKLRLYIYIKGNELVAVISILNIDIIIMKTVIYKKLTYFILTAWSLQVLMQEVAYNY